MLSRNSLGTDASAAFGPLHVRILSRPSASTFHATRREHVGSLIGGRRWERAGRSSPALIARHYGQLVMNAARELLELVNLR